jgi:DNA-binding transcriptional ArsR family regulator
MQNNINAVSKRQNDTLDKERFALICKALSHPARIYILEYLKQADRCICGKIVESLPLAQSTVSQHLKCLKQAGLVIGEVDGPRTCYCLDKGILKRFKKMVAAL